MNCVRTSTTPAAHYASLPSRVTQTIFAEISVLFLLFSSVEKRRCYEYVQAVLYLPYVYTIRTTDETQPAFSTLHKTPLDCLLLL